MILALVLMSQIAFNAVSVNAGVLTKEDKRIFLDSMNKYRSMVGVKPVQYLNDAERLANVRIETIYNHLKEISNSTSEKELRENRLYHLHYGVYIDSQLFNIRLRNDKRKNYIMITPSECIGLFFKNEDNMVEALFNGWKGSPSHWDGMMGETYDAIALEMKETEQGIIACLILFEKFDKK